MSSYSRKIKIQVAKEALLRENRGLEHVIASKYNVQTRTVIRWKEEYQLYGDLAFKKSKPKSAREIALEKQVADLEEEVKILKKAAAFLANVKHE